MPDFNLGAAMRNYKENNEILVLEAGSYTLEVTGAKATKSKNGNPTIIPQFKVAAGPYAGKRILAGNITYTENAAPFFFRALKGFGIDETFLEQVNSLDDPIEAIANALVGRVVEAHLTVDDWQGEARNKLGSVSLANGVTAAPAAPPAPAVQPPAVQPPAVQQAPVAPAPAPAAAPAAAPEPARAPSF